MAYPTYLNEEPENKEEKIRVAPYAGYSKDGDDWFYVALTFRHTKFKKVFKQTWKPASGAEAIIKNYSSNRTTENDLIMAETLLKTNRDTIKGSTGEEGKKEINKDAVRSGLLKIANQAVLAIEAGPPAPKQDEPNKDDDANKNKNKNNNSGRNKQYPDDGKKGIAKTVAVNRGNAAKIAGALGYKKTLSGVTKLVQDIQAKISDGGGESGADGTGDAGPGPAPEAGMRWKKYVVSGKKGGEVWPPLKMSYKKIIASDDSDKLAYWVTKGAAGNRDKDDVRVRVKKGADVANDMTLTKSLEKDKIQLVIKAAEKAGIKL
jgi:hypothetical protein